MKKKGSIGIFCICVWLFLSSFAYAQGIAVVVNEKSPLLDELKSSLEIKEVRDIYLGKLKFYKGSAIKAANHKDREILELFLRKVCGMGISEYQHHWVKLELETGINSPRVMESSEEILSYVRNEKAGIGYVLESEAKGVTGIRIVSLLQ